MTPNNGKYENPKIQNYDNYTNFQKMSKSDLCDFPQIWKNNGILQKNEMTFQVFSQPKKKNKCMSEGCLRGFTTIKKC